MIKVANEITSIEVGTTLAGSVISDVTASPFEDWELFQAQEEDRRNEIMSLLIRYTAIGFASAGWKIVFHPSAKQPGCYQITLIVDGLPISDSQHETINSVADRLMDYENLIIVNVIQAVNTPTTNRRESQ